VNNSSLLDPERDQLLKWLTVKAVDLRSA
jgi:hypothetical protein